MNKAQIAITKMLMNTDPAVVADACAISCLRLVESTQVDTAATDGVVLLVNPAFLDDLTIPQVCGLLVHEVCHARFGHTERFIDSGHLDHARANRSMDREINPIVAAAGYELPDGGCWPSQIRQPDGLAWEAYYPHEAAASPPPDDAGTKTVRSGCHGAGSLVADFAPDLLADADATPEAIADAIRNEIDDASQQSKTLPKAKAGTGSGSETLTGGELVLATDCRWQDVVIDLIASRASRETVTDWSRPSRRSLSAGYYRPARRRVGGLRLALVLDVSGSCVSFFKHWQAMARELVDAVSQVCEIEILYHDTRVVGRDRWERRTGDDLSIACHGGGGTCFRAVLGEVDGIDVDGAILFTDSEGSFPSRFSHDAVTVQPPGSIAKTPFGKTVRITKW